MRTSDTTYLAIMSDFHVSTTVTTWDIELFNPVMQSLDHINATSQAIFLLEDIMAESKTKSEEKQNFKMK